MREALAIFRATGAHTGVPLRLAILADAYGSVGQIEEGLALLAEAQALIDRSEERASEAEVYRHLLPSSQLVAAVIARMDCPTWLYPEPGCSPVVHGQVVDAVLE